MTKICSRKYYVLANIDNGIFLLASTFILPKKLTMCYLVQFETAPAIYLNRYDRYAALKR